MLICNDSIESNCMSMSRIQDPSEVPVPPMFPARGPGIAWQMRIPL
jgi:hypothetical protein